MRLCLLSATSSVLSLGRSTMPLGQARPLLAVRLGHRLAELVATESPGSAIDSP